MLRTNDDWEKLVTAVVRRQELCHAPSVSSQSSDSSCPSPLSDFHFEISAYDSIVDSISRNTLKPGEVYVNGKPLDRRELDILQGCHIPPTAIKPGTYWYDRRAGFWGKVYQILPTFSTFKTHYLPQQISCFVDLFALQLHFMILISLIKQTMTFC